MVAQFEFRDQTKGGEYWFALESGKELSGFVLRTTPGHISFDRRSNEMWLAQAKFETQRLEIREKPGFVLRLRRGSLRPQPGVDVQRYEVTGKVRLRATHFAGTLLIRPLVE